MVPIADLHNDLLGYLCLSEARTPSDTAPRSGLSQLTAGGVRLMALAIGWVTEKGSTEYGERQIACYSALLREHAGAFRPFPRDSDLLSPTVQVLPAIENASVIAEEEEPLQNALARLEKISKTFGPPLYIGLTWNGENRFGGGVGAKAGLKPDGKELLQQIHRTGTAVDLSHTSDKLAYEILNVIDQHRLEIPVIASHSNFRAVVDTPRNLPKELVQEVIDRQGLIGLNLFAPFLGSVEQIPEQIAYALELGGADAIALGADFFNEQDGAQILSRYPGADLFLPEFPDSSSFPRLLSLLKTKLVLTDAQLAKLAHGNALAYLHRQKALFSLSSG